MMPFYKILLTERIGSQKVAQLYVK